MSARPRLPLVSALVLAASALIGPAPSAAAQSQEAAVLRLPAVFGDHMVMQRDTTAALWGWAAPGAEVTVIADWPGAEEATAVADANGRFRVDLRTGAAGGPYRVEVHAGAAARTLTDVLLGEVWLASGQSNMEWPLRAAEVGSATLAASSTTPPRLDRPRMRLFRVAHAVAVTPQDDVRGNWQACTPEAAQDFSAVALHFGSVLADELDVPIGLVETAWGGTPAEAWTPGEALEPIATLASSLTAVREQARDAASSESRQEARAARHWKAVDAADPGIAGGWKDAGFDAATWTEAALPGTWESAGLDGMDAFDGLVWYRRTLDVPAAWAGRDLVLELGPIDDMDWVWFDGALVGSRTGADQWNRPRRYTVPAAQVAGGTATLAVRVYDTGGAGGLAGAPEALRLFPTGSPDAALPLAGRWRMQRSTAHAELPRMPQGANANQNSPTTLWNGMVAPLVPMAAAGAIWYQGESNRTRWQEYRTLFPTMITAWRQAFGNRLPFYFVQIAPFGYGGDQGQAAALREAQAFALELPDTGMVVTMDLGNPADIHPRNKHEVGRRLALWAMRDCYGREGLLPSGPTFDGLEAVDGGLRVSFRHTADGLVAPGGLTSFEVAGEDGVWHPAEARIADDGVSVLVRADAVSTPVEVRYAWGAADPAELFHTGGLPASSFRSHP